MPMTSVNLRPGVNVQRTLSQNEAGVSDSQMIRYKDGLIQKIGGWESYSPISFNSTILEIHPWQGLDANKFLGIGATGVSTTGFSSNNSNSLTVITAGSLSDVTPQTRVSDFAPAFTTAVGSCFVSIEDAGSSANIFSSIFFNTPVAVGGMLLSGCYPIYSIGGSSTYTIVSSVVASCTVTKGGTLPVFATQTDSSILSVTLPSNNYLKVTGLFYGFYAPTSVGGLTIQGNYQVRSILDSTTFEIVAATQSSAADTQTMNGGQAELVYYITLGPPGAGGLGGYGTGAYGFGGYGVGSPLSAGGTGNPISATDWTMDNWGEVLIACPEDGPIYTWSPDSGFTTASIITTGPMFNGGVFVSMPQDIVVAWRSCQGTGVQDNLTVKWSDAGDYNNWTISNQTAAGDFHIPTGSVIMGGIQAPNYGVIWTDIDAWIMQYVGGTVIFNFTRVGTGCGLIGKHAAGVIAGSVYWCGTNNFFTITGNGVQPVPCSVWDFIFQNLNQNYVGKIRCAPNSTFNEITWFFPSADSTGQNDSFVTLNISENEWTKGTLGRTAWADVSVLGTPIGTDVTQIYQHEQTQNADGQPLATSFETGYWAISDGNELSFVDWVLPDMKFGTYSGSQTASCQITFYSVDYPGDTPRSYGPYTFTNATEYINTRIRGRLMSMKVQSNDLNSFWRLGRVRYRFASAGRR